MQIELDLGDVADSDALHELFARQLGFPDFYGRNMNAWVDCMSNISRPGTPGMTRVEVAAGEDLVLVLRGTDAFVERLPELASQLVQATGHVNMRTEAGGAGRVLLLPA